jgi:hypothetical protein
VNALTLMVTPLLVVSGDGFSGWLALNDTIMGGNSRGVCRVGPEGLVLEAEVVEQGGGFVSCRSPLFSPPLNLGDYRALQLEVRGDGRRYKLAVACADGVAGLTELIPGGLRWVAEFDTTDSTPALPPQLVEIPFDQLRPSVRARPLNLPLRFDACRVTRLQVLHSKFGEDGQLNAGFRAGPLQFALVSVRAVP